MRSLYEYVLQDDITDIDEGLFSAGITALTLKNMDPEHFKIGLLSMYDYIVDDDNMDLFYQDFPLKERPMWKNLYKLYTKKVWSIVDYQVDDKGQGLNNTNSERNDENVYMGIGPTLTKITPELRREIRNVINNSRNSGLELKPSELDLAMTVYDKVNDKHYLVTINRTSSLSSRIFRAADKKALETAFNKLNLSL